MPVFVKALKLRKIILRKERVPSSSIGSTVRQWQKKFASGRRRNLRGHEYEF